MVSNVFNSIYVDAGSYVKRGQPLIKLDDALLRLQIQSVAVQIEGLETDVKRYTVAGVVAKYIDDF